MHVSGNIKHMQAACLVGGGVAFGVSALMAWKFGSSMSWAHGVALVVACFVAAVIVPMGRYIKSFGVNVRTIQAATVFFLALEFLSHLGYTFGMRDRLSVEAGAQTVAYEAVQDNLKSEKVNVDLWRNQKVALEKERTSMVAASPWATTLTTDALRKQVTDLDSKIVEETKGGRGGRAKGCKQVCEQLKDERTAVEKQIAALEKIDVVTNRLAELDKQIEATQRIIDTKVATATTTKKGHSVAKAQTEAFAEVGLLFTTLDADAAFGKGDKSVAQKIADYVIGTMMAIGATLAPSALLYFGMFAPAARRKDDIETVENPHHSPVSAPGNRNDETRAYPSHPTVTFSRMTAGDINRAKVQDLLDRLPGRIEAKAA